MCMGQVSPLEKQKIRLHGTHEWDNKKNVEQKLMHMEQVTIASGTKGQSSCVDHNTRAQKYLWNKNNAYETSHNR